MYCVSIFLNAIGAWARMKTKTSFQVFEELLLEDNKILKQLKIGEKDHKKILDNYTLRVNLYKEFAETR